LTAEALITPSGVPPMPHRKSAVRSGETAVFLERRDRLRELRFGRIGRNVEHEDRAVVDARQPQLAAVVGEAAVMRLVAPADRDRLDRLAESGRAFSHVDGDELVGAVAHALDAERPDIDVVLLAGDLRHVGRLAGLVGKRRQRCAGKQREGGSAAEKPANAWRQSLP